MQYLIFLAAVTAAAYGAYTGAGWALVTGALLAVVAASRWGTRRSERDAATVRRLFAALFGRWWKIAFWLAPLSAVAASWLERRNAVDPLALLAWLLGIGLLLAGSLAHDAGVGLGRTAPGTMRWTRADWGAVVILGLVALGLRLYWLDKGLPYMHGDEGEMGQLARLAVFGPAPGRGEQPLPFFRTGFLDHPTLFHYLQGCFLIWFGNNAYSLKVLSALAGALCVPFIYAAGRVGWGRMAGWGAAWLLAVSHLHIHFSRLALNNIESVLFGAIFLCLVLVAYAAGELPPRQRNSPAPAAAESPGPGGAHSPPATGRLALYVALGLSLGLSQYFYYGSRLLPVVALPLLLLLWRQRRLSEIHWLGTGLALFVSYWPLFAFYLENWPAFLNRTAGVSILQPDALRHALGPGAVWPTDLPLLLLYQVQHVVGFLMRDGDRSAFYAAELPAFDPVTVALFWLGVGVLLAQWRRFAAQAVLIYLLCGLVLAGVLTNDTPNAPRLILVAPALVLACGAALEKLFDLLRQLAPRQQQWLAAALGGVLVVSTLPVNFDAYFNQFWGMQRLALMTVAAEQMERYASTHRAYFLGAPVLYTENGVVRFIAEDAEMVNVLDESQLQQASQAAGAGGQGKGALFVVLPHRFAEWQALRVILPAGDEETFYDAHGTELLKTYRVDAR